MTQAVPGGGAPGYGTTADSREVDQMGITADALRWPYPVRYGEETEIRTDVLVIGGGLAGAYAAINAALTGARVTLVEKGVSEWGGSGGAGIDHWHDVCSDPACAVSAEEMAGLDGRFGCPAHIKYIVCRGSFDALLELEEMGLPIRDVDDEFAGAPFRDDNTKLMYAYDYQAKHCVRLRGGARIRPVLQGELMRRGVQIVDRVMITSLLSEDGEPGGRVVGATGVNSRTGEFLVFNAKTTVLTTGPVSRLWAFTTELVGHNDELWDPTCAGDGHAMAWDAGAAFIDLERGGFHFGGQGFMYAPYGTGNSENTWAPCTIVDSEGKEIPWEDEDGRILETIDDRARPAASQKFFHHGFARIQGHGWPTLIRDLPERIRAGEYKLPLYADLPSMPEQERRAIWGLMIGNEGKTRWAIYEPYIKAGFDPNTDMLQANVMAPEQMYLEWPWWSHYGAPQWLDSSGIGTLLVDWDLMTSLEGLYAAGMIGGAGGAAGACASGRYAGRKAGEFALSAADRPAHRGQLEREKERVYSQLAPPEGDATGWKEVHAGVARVMQDYCSVIKSESILSRGLDWLQSIRESEASRLRARNPRELVRGLQTLSRLTVAEMVLRGSLARKGSSAKANLERVDFPAFDEEDWAEVIVLRPEDGQIKEERIPRTFYLEAPYAPSLAENYGRHAVVFEEENHGRSVS
jgi:succinate dehydrogenase/fumarate reductase flavoprotein subunit